MDAAGPIAKVSVGAALGGRFRLEEKLAEDASGETYRALDEDGGGVVIVRLLRPEGGSARRERLVRETKRAAQVKHEGLALVLGSGQTEAGDTFVAVEPLDGERLSDRLRAAAPLSDREAATIAMQVARALAAAHDVGVVHRELRPSLVFLSGSGEKTRVKVEGLATGRSWRQAGSEDDRAYAAPEQQLDENVGRRADVYSIGAMLHAMLTGAVPAAATKPIPGPLGDVVRRCLAVDPRDRFLDTIALAAALRAAMEPDDAQTSAPVSERAAPAPPSAARPPAAPPPRPLGRPLTARPRWEEALLDLRDGPLPRVALTFVVAFVVTRLLSSGVVPFVVAIAAAVAAYAMKYVRSRKRRDL